MKIGILLKVFDLINIMCILPCLILFKARTLLMWLQRIVWVGWFVFLH